MIRSGEKTEEYREIKEYWAPRLLNFNYDAYELYGMDEMLSDMKALMN